MSRDIAYERKWTDELKAEARRLFGGDSDAFFNQMEARLRRGDAVFGAEFLERDNLREALEEGCDFLAYLMFDAEANRGHPDYEDAPELFRAAAMLVKVDEIVRDVWHRRRERMRHG